MKQPIGISICIGKNAGGFGFYIGRPLLKTVRPRTDHSGNPESIMTFGFRMDILFGRIVRPIPKFWHKGFWSKDPEIYESYRPWTSGNHAFVFDTKIPFPALFLSASLGIWKWKDKTFNPGGYTGWCILPGLAGRTAQMDAMGHQKAIWNSNGDITGWEKNADGSPVYAWGDASIDDMIFVEPTVTIRLDMRH